MGSARFLQTAHSLSAHPISVAEFSKALLQRWSPQRDGQDTLGLAISGGVDSMALAALCSRLRNHCYSYNQSGTKGELLERETLSLLKIQAFIVDHGLRSGSGVEAEAVSKILKGRDIRTRVLKMDWPGQEFPASLPNFESLARKYRFRLLGRACRDLGISSLLLAHHEDDQVETVFMRLAGGQGAKGLAGMQSPAGIPECYGIHGVYESGGYNNTTGENIDRRQRLDPAAVGWSRPDSLFKNQLPIEAGGIQIYRPFLNFSKARLIATCMAENMEWFEDPTNAEPTTTKRNAIRHMYMNHSMPAALTKPALLALSMRLNDKAAHRSDIVEFWLARCKITHFETRTGTVKLRFADLTQFHKSNNVSLPADAAWVAAELLRRVIQLVMPLEQVNSSSLHNAVQRVFPEASQQGKQCLQSTAFTASGVYFQPVLVIHPKDTSLDVISQKSQWILSRQPYISGSLPMLQLGYPSNSYHWSPWHLYDGRYWIRVQHPRTASLFVQPFMKDHVGDFRASLVKSDRLRLIRTLRTMAPGIIRWTLPAIVRKEENGKVTLIALPSLNLSIPESGVKWEIRYKKISHSHLLGRDICQE
ncbi:adenine nucleotide alpha hydrolases-like protein [Stipitochalara longipes BDJ]|nr:adenine nucleotide alpha hydrolases-like protein [Stipitochalara longipes BDJ]